MKHKTYLQIAVAFAMALLTTVAFANGMPEPALLFLLAPAGIATMEELATEFASKTRELSTISGDLKQMQTELIAKTAGNDATIASIKESVDQWLTKFNGVKGTVDELEQKLSARVDNDSKGEKSWGEQFVAAPSYKSASEAGDAGSKRHTMAAQVKAVTSTAAGGLIRSARETDIVELVRERRVVRDLLRTIPINTSSVDYAVQTTRTNMAAPVAEAAAKPYSDYAWGSATAVVRTLAHLTKITRQAMDDAPRLMGEIDSEMRYGLGFVEERQFLYGSGVGQNLLGIIPQATAFARPAGVTQQTGITRLDTLRFAMLQASIGLLPADGIVLNETDWALIELTKTTDGAYLFANPQGNVSARMWALPVVATPAMTVGSFLVGSFQLGAVIYDRMAVEVLISTENVDDFEKNLATMRAEERVALAVKRPQAFTTGTFATAKTALEAI